MQRIVIVNSSDVPIGTETNPIVVKEGDNG